MGLQLGQVQQHVGLDDRSRDLEAPADDPVGVIENDHVREVRHLDPLFFQDGQDSRLSERRARLGDRRVVADNGDAADASDLAHHRPHDFWVRGDRLFGGCRDQQVHLAKDPGSRGNEAFESSDVVEALPNGRRDGVLRIGRAGLHGYDRL